MYLHFNFVLFKESTIIFIIPIKQFLAQACVFYMCKKPRRKNAGVFCKRMP